MQVQPADSADTAVEALIGAAPSDRARFSAKLPSYLLTLRQTFVDVHVQCDGELCPRYSETALTDAPSRIASVARLCRIVWADILPPRIRLPAS